MKGLPIEELIFGKWWGLQPLSCPGCDTPYVFTALCWPADDTQPWRCHVKGVRG